MKDEYIRREDAIRIAEQGQVQGFPWQFQMLVRLPPADVVPVVRCDDCVYYGSRRWCELHSSVFDDNAFCSYGERREE